MEEIPKADSLVRSVRALTVVVGCLTLVLLGQFGLYAYSFYKASKFSARPTEHSSSRGESGIPPDSRDFNTLSAEEKIRRARGILLTRNQQEGGKRKAIVLEILKQPKGEPFEYAVGEEYPDLSRYGGEASSRGDGDVVFFVNSDSQLTVSYSYRDGRIGGLQDMPLELLRALATGKPASAAPSGSGAPPSGTSSPLPRSSSRYAASPSDPGDRVTLQTTTDANGTRSVYWIPKEVAEKAVVWRPETGEPPLSVVRAMSIAVAASRRAHPAAGTPRVKSISLQGMSCTPVIPDRWYYMAYLVPVSAGGEQDGEGSWQVVLLNGDVVTPEIEPRSP